MPTQVGQYVLCLDPRLWLLVANWFLSIHSSKLDVYGSLIIIIKYCFKSGLHSSERSKCQIDQQNFAAGRKSPLHLISL